MKVISLVTACLSLFSHARAEEDQYDVYMSGWGEDYAEVLDQYGVVLNPEVSKFEEELKENDALTLLYVFDSATLVDESAAMASHVHKTVIGPVFKELKGFGKFYAFDCQAPSIKNRNGTSYEDAFANCEYEDRDKFAPGLTLFSTPEQRKNPYTGKPMEKS